MKTSNDGINLIKQFEGLRLTAYRCPAGVLTIGYGHTGSICEGQIITEETADKYLRDDLIKFENHVNEINILNKYHFTQNEFDALVSFAFNVGSIYGLTAHGTRNKRTIADKMLLYNKAGGRVLQGLVKRREKERELFTRNVSRETFKTVNDIANEVIAGKWGNGVQRKKKLTEAGYDYEEIRKRVNEIKKGG